MATYPPAHPAWTSRGPSCLPRPPYLSPCTDAQPLGREPPSDSWSPRSGPAQPRVMPEPSYSTGSAKGVAHVHEIQAHTPRLPHHPRQQKQHTQPRMRVFVLFILLRLEDPRLLSTCLSRSTFAWPSPASLPPLPLSLKVRIHLTMASLLPSGPERSLFPTSCPHSPTTNRLPRALESACGLNTQNSAWHRANLALDGACPPALPHCSSLHSTSLEAPSASWSTLLTRCLSQLTFTAAQVCPLLHPSLLL